MTRVAVLEPATLTGQEIKEALEQRRELWSDLRLLTVDPDDHGVLSEVSGEATLVQELSGDSLEGVDLLFVCAERSTDPAEILARTSAVPRTVLVSPGLLPPGLTTVIAGVNLAAVDTGREPLQLVSPAPTAVALAHLLHPLMPLGPTEAVGWLVQPASVHGQAGVDELLDQTRAILAFQSDFPRAVFGGQLALNLMPARGSQQIIEAVRKALGDDLKLSAQVIQGPIFHSVAAAALVRLPQSTTEDDVRQALSGSPYVEVTAEPGALGPIDASGKDSLLVGDVSAHPEEAGAFWLWGVMDNLTLGGAGNALAIAEALLGAAH